MATSKEELLQIHSMMAGIAFVTPDTAADGYTAEAVKQHLLFYNRLLKENKPVLEMMRKVRESVRMEAAQECCELAEQYEGGKCEMYDLIETHFDFKAE